MQGQVIMDCTRLHTILSETTVQLRKGEVVENKTVGNVQVTTINMMPHESEARPEIEKIDLEFLVVGVNRAAAEVHRDELIAILNKYPLAPAGTNRLLDGPSYIEVGAVIGDQGAAFQLFALGKVLGLWEIITPRTFGAHGADAERLAGLGYIMISGFKP